ncbi:MAG: efflux RND transporter permease subunit [Bacteroidota bacterium]
MNLTRFALKNDRITLLALALIAILGLLSYNELARDSMPPFTVRTANVITTFPGAGPEKIEALITDKIETAAQEIPEVKYIASTSRTALSQVTVALKDDVPPEDLQAIWDRLRRKIDLIVDDFPDGTNEPEIKDEDIGVVYGIFVGLTSDGFENPELRDYADDLRNRIIQLDDAAKVEIGGIVDERIFIDYNDAELARLGLSSGQLTNTIAATNIVIPAGNITLAGEEVGLEPSGNLESVEDLENMLIPLANGESVRLKEIAVVRRAYITPREEIVRVNGFEGQALYVSLKENANIIELGRQVDQLLVEYNRTLPVGIEAIRLASQDAFVEGSVNDFVNNVIQSVIIVLLVMFAFMGVRMGLVVAALIPMTIICTIFMMDTFSIGLNQVSLAALIMALGLLVDNAIVMAESILVKMEKGVPKQEAAFQSGKELFTPLLISSLTTSAAFLAFFLAESTMGDIMGPLFSVISIALISSWLFTMTAIPMLSLAILKVKQKKKEENDGIFGVLGKYYRVLLLGSLHRRWLTVAVCVVGFGLAIFGMTFVPVIFMPDSDRNLVTLDMNLPLGTSIETTERQVDLLETFLRDSLMAGDEVEGVIDWSTYIGKGPKSYDLGYNPGEQNSGYAHMLINTSTDQVNGELIRRLDNFCFFNLPDAQVKVKRLGTGGGASVPIQIRLAGDEAGDLFEVAAQIKRQLNAIPGTKNVDDNWGPRIKKFFVQVNEDKLRRNGLTNQDLAVSLRTVLAGTNVGEFREDNNSIPIVMQAKGGGKLDYSTIESLSIFAQASGRNVPLAEVATLVPQWEYAKVLRRDLKRNLTVEASVNDGFTAAGIIEQLTSWMDETQADWPGDVTYELGGDDESRGDAMGAVMEKLPLAGFIIIMLLVIQFNSFRKSFIILATIPLGIIGVTFGLLITGEVYSFTSFLGVISLAGIVINDSIVLMDKIDIQINRYKKPPAEGIVQASVDKLRPVILTTLTTSLGLIPLWIGGGDMWRPMAVGMIFGLLFATFVILLFVPVLYALLFRVNYGKGAALTQPVPVADAPASVIPPTEEATSTG